MGKLKGRAQVSNKTGSNLGPNPKAILINGKIATDFREFWIQPIMFSREAVGGEALWISLLAHVKQGWNKHWKTNYRG